MQGTFRVTGGARLVGEVTIAGAKNSALKLMAATLLAEGRSKILNVPNIADVHIMEELLTRLGCTCEYNESDLTLKVDVPSKPGHRADYDLVRKMRASINVLGPLLARLKIVEVALPGGDAIGSRGLDYHIKGLELLGAKIHLEVESGMGRGGFLSEWPELLNRDLSKVVGIFTHFARADEPNETQNQQQIEKFNNFVADLNHLGIKPLRHISNTAAALSNVNAGFDMVRIGIAMYGYSPLNRDQNLKPIMKLRSKLVLVKEMPAGHPIGYGATEFTISATKIGIVGLGYADGIPRNAQGAGVSFEGKKAPIIGRVSMDQFAVDLGAESKAKSGDWVEVFGDEFSVYDWADASKTITYEITTRIGGRIPRIYK